MYIPSRELGFVSLKPTKMKTVRIAFVLSICALTPLVAAAKAPDFTKLDNLELCGFVRRGKVDALAELIRRKTFTTEELAYIDSATPYIGMSLGAAHCAFGNALKVNETHTASGSHVQLVMPDGRYFYFDNGRLTAWQD